MVILDFGFFILNLLKNKRKLFLFSKIRKKVFLEWDVNDNFKIREIGNFYFGLGIFYFVEVVFLDLFWVSLFCFGIIWVCEIFNYVKY